MVLCCKSSLEGMLSNSLWNVRCLGQKIFIDASESLGR